MWRPLARCSLIVIVVILAGIQLVPYGRAHTTPPVQAEPAWNSQQTRALAARACYDCHSNQTRWPWYSHVAPASWLVQKHVDDGRAKLNFSEWNRPQEGAESAEAVQEGEMPLRSYLLAHPEARLSPGEFQALVQGLAATFGQEGERTGASGEEEEREEHED
jgi:mono/diheme cytochrome c family protein